MTRRSLWGFGLFLSATMLPVFAQPVRAAENWTPRLPGISEGTPAGALPPKGFYFINTTKLAPFTLYDNDGNNAGITTDVFVEVPMLLWNPGIKVLGADYAMGIAQPMTRVSPNGGGLTQSEWGLFSTVLIPGKLAWQLPNDFHVSVGLAVYLPDGTAQKSVLSYENGDYSGIPNSINYWALEPSLGISWLRNGWNISASFNYDINFKNTDSGYSSGNALIGDYTITKTIGPWTVGIGGYSVNQLEDDKSEVAAIQAVIDGADGNRQTKYAAGPIVGYDFGKASLTGFYNRGWGAKNVVSGDSFWTRLVVPF